MVTCKISSILAGITAFNEPSLAKVNEETIPLVASMIRIVVPGGNEPAGADTVTSPLAAGIEKTIWLVSCTGGGVDAVAKVAVWTEIGPRTTSANPAACTAYSGDGVS